MAEQLYFNAAKAFGATQAMYDTALKHMLTLAQFPPVNREAIRKLHQYYQPMCEALAQRSGGKP